MDARQRHALEDLLRSAVGRDLDELAGELTMLRRQVVVLERLAGLSTAPAGQQERRERAAELRQAGLSTRAIASALASHRNTIVSDLRLLGVQPPSGEVVGLDGRVTRPRARPTP